MARNLRKRVGITKPQPKKKLVAPRNNNVPTPIVTNSSRPVDTSIGYTSIPMQTNFNQYQTRPVETNIGYTSVPMQTNFNQYQNQVQAGPVSQFPMQTNFNQYQNRVQAGPVSQFPIQRAVPMPNHMNHMAPNSNVMYGPQTFSNFNTVYGANHYNNAYNYVAT